MKLKIEATAEELKTKGPALLKALQVRLQEHDPVTAAALLKALQPSAAEDHEGDSPTFPVVESMIARANKLYAQHMQAMLDEISEVLDDHVAAQLAPPEPAPDNVVDLLKRG